MNVFLLTDMEGIAGIDRISDLERDTEDFEKSVEKLASSINLAIDACFAGGAERVYWLDGHGGGNNVPAAKIDARGVKCTIEDWHTLLQNGEVDCQIALGDHARAGTVGGFLDHTISSKKYFCIKHNGREMSEFAIQATFCAKFGVPIVAVIGDRAACLQAREYVPDVFVGAVKEATCRNVATTYPHADEILRKTILDALHGYKRVSLIGFCEPITVEQTYYRTDMCEAALAKYPAGSVLRVDARTLRKTVDTVTCYRELRI
ncbi:MAG: hypothetical protein E7637_05590 [Ruminococcaceae bacterium]|nr:hypothetical protein [Oscillospiraceae bacterium]